MVTICDNYPHVVWHHELSFYPGQYRKISGEIAFFRQDFIICALTEAEFKNIPWEILIGAADLKSVTTSLPYYWLTKKPRHTLLYWFSHERNRLCSHAVVHLLHTCQWSQVSAVSLELGYIPERKPRVPGSCSHRTREIHQRFGKNEWRCHWNFVGGERAGEKVRDMI